MYISPLNYSNITFGYDKKLNRQLNAKLDSVPKTSVTLLIENMNSSCNTIENEIIRLERQNQGGIDRNQEQINILLAYFMGAKRLLCALVERIFPELDFRNKTIEELDKNYAEISKQREGTLLEINKEPAYIWREQLFTAMNDDIEDRNNKINQKLGLAEADYDDDASQVTLKKFMPLSYSPKSLDDIVGLDKSIDDIRDLIIFPLEHPEEAKQREEEYGIKVPSFSVFFGPPGCGKTMLAEAIAIETGCDMYTLDLSQVGSSYVNGTVLKIAKMFDEVAEIAQDSEKPVILFMDELDSILTKRSGGDSSNKEDDKVVNALLPLITKMQDKNVLILGATNMYDALDPAAKRRIQYKAYIGLPNENDIKKLLQKRLSTFKMGEKLASSDESLDNISKKLVGYSPSIIVNMVLDASKVAYRNHREVIEQDFDEVLRNENYDKIKEKEYLPDNKKPKFQMGFHQ